MSKTITLGGKPYRYRYGIRAFVSFEHLTGRTYTGATITDQVLMMGCTLYDEDGNQPDFDRLADELDTRPNLLKEWIALFAQDADRWAKAFDAEAHSQDEQPKKKE